MPDLPYLRNEIERIRLQVGRQRREILKLQRAGISTASADALLQRMVDKVNSLCAERDKLVQDMSALLDAQVDRFLLLRLDPRSRVYTLGKAIAPSDPDFFYAA